MTTSPTISQSQVSTSSARHSMPNMDVWYMSAVTSLMLRVCCCLCAAMSFVWADITLPTTTNHQLNTGTTQICHQSFLILQSWLETLTAVIRTGDIRRLIWMGSPCKSGHWTTICCCTTSSNVARSTLQGGNMTTRQSCAGSQRQSVAHSLPPLWFLVTSPTVSTDLQLFTSASNFPSSEESNAEDGTSGQLTGLAILSPQNVLFRWLLSTTSALRNHTSISVVLCRKQPAIPYHKASAQRILRVWMRSAKIYWSNTRSLVTQT